MLRHYGRLLELFPFSPQNPAESALRIQAVSSGEPPLLERAFTDPVDVADVLAAASEFRHADCAYTLESWWGLWIHDRDWVLRPARVVLQCFGPAFSDSPQAEGDPNPENLRIDFGVDTWFLPQAELPNPAWYARSNIKSLLKLTQEMEEALPIDQRALWSESGANFASRLREAAEDL